MTKNKKTEEKNVPSENVGTNQNKDTNINEGSFKNVVKNHKTLILTYFTITVISAILYGLTQIPSDSFVSIMKINLGKDYIEYAFIASFFIFIIAVALFWSLAFYHYIKADKNEGNSSYNFHHYVGIWGVGISLFSLPLSFINNQFIYPLMVSGLLCLYSSLITFFNYVKDSMKSPGLESYILTISLVVPFIYSLKVGSSIFINEIFGIDASYFTLTSPLFMAVLLLLISGLLAGFFLCIAIVKLFKIKNIELFHVTAFMSAYIIFAISISTNKTIRPNIVKFATSTDFNSGHPCKFKSMRDKEVISAIILDSAQNYARVAMRVLSDDKIIFETMRCNINAAIDNIKVVDKKHPQNIHNG